MTATTVTFLGAAGSVTGSRHLIDTGGRRILLDCGLFQGPKALRSRNWNPFPVEPSSIDAVVLSHAHIDHCGYLPALVRDGFRGPIHCTTATGDLLGVMLRDAGYLQEEQADRANRRRFSKHHPALPLFTIEDAERVLPLTVTHRYDDPFEVAEAATVTLRPAGHILGSASVDCLLAHDNRRVVFSGDLGRWDRPILHDPALVPEADLLILESTYGNRDHPSATESLQGIVRDVADRGGALVIPAFAIGRTQELVYRLRRLEDEGRIPVLPVYVDSPMAITATEIYGRHPEDHDPRMRDKHAAGAALATTDFNICRTVEASKGLNEVRGPIIIISASGMATGGRILHHLKRRLPDERNTVLLVGFQAFGTRGRKLLEGAEEIRIHGADVPVRATIDKLNGASAHADRGELLRWLRGFERPPARTFLVHGEPEASGALARAVGDEFGWEVAAAEDGQMAEV